MDYVKPSYLFFMTFMIQGSLILIVQLPHFLANYFGYNGWLAVPIISLLVLCHIGLIYLVYRLGHGESIFTIIEKSIPVPIFKLVYILLSFFWAGFAIFILKQYLFIVKFLYYPELNIHWLMYVTLFLVIYLVVSGILSIVHTITILFFILIFITMALVYFVPYFSILELTNFFFAEHHQWLKGAFDIYVSFLGFEVVIFFFPYLKKGKKVFRYVVYGHLFTTLIYTIIALISFSFNSLEQLRIQVYPIINLLQYIEFEFVERVDSLFFLLLFLRVFTTVTMYIWIGMETCQRVFRLKSMYWAFILTSLGYVMTLPILNRFEINQYFSYLAVTQVAIAIALPVLLIGLINYQRWRSLV